MNVIDRTRYLERFQFFNGQRLFASDLQDLEAFNREMRWLHNASLHQPGIGAGFKVVGAKGDRQVTIGPGYAIDVDGREIVLNDDVVEPIPPVAGNADGTPAVFYLTISYPSDDALDPVETRIGVCTAGGAIRLRERPVICWVRLEFDDQLKRFAAPPPYAKEILEGRRLVLGQATVLNCQLFDAFCVVQRRSARTSRQPEIACDYKCFVKKTFHDRDFFTFHADSHIGVLNVPIETHLERFCATPCYLVRASIKDLKKQTIPPYWITTPSVDGATVSAFNTQVVIGSILQKHPLTVKALDDVELCIHWLAIEG